MNCLFRRLQVWDQSQPIRAKPVGEQMRKLPPFTCKTVKTWLTTNYWPLLQGLRHRNASIRPWNWYVAHATRGQQLVKWGLLPPPANALQRVSPFSAKPHRHCQSANQQTDSSGTRWALEQTLDLSWKVLTCLRENPLFNFIQRSQLKVKTECHSRWSGSAGCGSFFRAASDWWTKWSNGAWTRKRGGQQQQVFRIKKKFEWIPFF